MFVPLRTAAKHYNVSKQTISAWATKGYLDFTVLPGGHRRFRIRGDGNLDIREDGQKEDLERQIAYMRQKYPGWEIVSDVGSGLNWKRTGLRTILRRCVQGDIGCVAVAHKDRLARFGYEIIEFILGECGVQLRCDDSGTHVSKERELVDILSIVTVFSARIHGQRHYNQKDPKDRPRPTKRSRTETEGVDGVLQENV
jgi:predicted site-specific integrase-resolvase